MLSRVVTSVAVVLLALLLATGTASAQDVSKGARCEPDFVYRYSFTTPTAGTLTGWPDFQATLYYNNYAATFLVMVFDDDSDTVVSSSGYTRFVQIRTGLLPGKRYELWVGCLTASADFRLLVNMGDVESITGRGTVRRATGGFDAAEQLAYLEREAEMRERLAELAAVAR